MLWTTRHAVTIQTGVTAFINNFAFLLHKQQVLRKLGVQSPISSPDVPPPANIMDKGCHGSTNSDNWLGTEQSLRGEPGGKKSKLTYKMLYIYSTWFSTRMHRKTG